MPDGTFYVVATLETRIGNRDSALQLLHLRDARQSYYPLFLSRLDAMILAQEREAEGYMPLPHHLPDVRAALREGFELGLGIAVAVGFTQTNEGELLRDNGHLCTNHLPCPDVTIARLLAEVPSAKADIVTRCRRTLLQTGVPDEYWLHLDAINRMGETDLRVHAQRALLALPTRRGIRYADSNAVVSD